MIKNWIIYNFKKQNLNKLTHSLWDTWHKRWRCRLIFQRIYPFCLVCPTRTLPWPATTRLSSSEWLTESSLVSHFTHIWTLLKRFQLEKTSYLQEPINDELLSSMKTGGGPTLRGTLRPKQENNSIPRIAPKWLKYDRQVSQLKV